mmetsp:Transcript_68470/g.164419  ORF Transcript_68470/g.164419 Transcript_68470/m.164419 type:complete len:758 (-) Transcript_68470:153-2426(-)
MRQLAAQASFGSYNDLEEVDEELESSSKVGLMQALWEKHANVARALTRTFKKEAPNLPSPRGTYEENAARSAVKFEIAFLFIEVIVVFVGLITHQGRPWPVEGVNLWPAGFFSICHRILVLLLRPTLKCMLPKCALRWTPAVSFLLDGILMASCHPAISHKVWSLETPPVPPVWAGFQAIFTPDRMVGLTPAEAKASYASIESGVSFWISSFEQWNADLYHFNNMQCEEYMLIHYLLNIMVWKYCMFVLTAKQALCLAPLVAATYSLTSIFSHSFHESEPFKGLEVSLVFFNVFVAVASKFKLERLQRIEFMFAEERRQEVIKERVLRYEAEFEKERLAVDWESRKRESDVASVAASQLKSLCSSAVTRAAASIKSAPAALHEGVVMNQMLRSGECLPPDAVVWVEGQALPCPVSNISPGEKVLCYDSLSLVPKFVEVTDSNTILGNASWVSVTLDDDTTLTLTADHPTQPRRSLGDLPLAGHVAAQDLKEGSDSLMVLKMLPVKVRSVVPTRDTVKERVALTLKNPDRHEVFVAGAGGGVPGQEMSTMAVGSANAAAPAATDPLGAGMGKRAFGLTVKRTFIDLEEEPQRSSQRSGSCPPRLCASDAAAKPKGVTFAKNTEVTSGNGPRLRRVASESDIASQSSRQSSAPTDVDVLVAVTSGVGAATVSEILEARKGGLPSRGSIGHDHGNCQVCFFQNRHQHGEGPPCFKGALCDRCHCQHELVGRKKRIPGTTRQPRKMQFRSNQCDDSPRCVP